MTTDSSGNIYAVGYINGNTEYNFGNGVTVSGAWDVAIGNNAVLVKYNSAGLAQWARSTTVAPNGSLFNNVALDSSGNIYVVGALSQDGEYNFGNGVTVTGVYGSSNNALIVKYNSEGLAQWAKSPTTAPQSSSFYSDLVDASGNIYAVGYIKFNGQYNFGNGVTATGNYASGLNAVVVKYNSEGLTQWATSTTTAPNASAFNNVARDPSGNIYAAGSIKNNGQYNFGNSVTVSGNYATSYNVLIVKYDSSGLAQWAKSTTTAPGESKFNDIVFDASGNFYAAGYITGSSEYNFGNSITVTGNSAGRNTLMVKYNTSGDAQWGKSTVSAPTDSWSEIMGVSRNSSDGIYAVGYNSDNGMYDFGNSVTVAGASEFGNVLIIKYNSDGSALWAKSTVTAPDLEISLFNGVEVNPFDGVYAAGKIDGTDPYSFGPDGGTTVSGAYSGDNAVIVKYAGQTTSPQLLNLPGTASIVNLTDGEVINSTIFTILIKPESDNGIAKVEFYVDDVLICTDTTADANGVYSCDWNTTLYHSNVKIIAYDTLGQTTTILRTVITASELPETGAGRFDFASVLHIVIQYLSYMKY